MTPPVLAVVVPADVDDPAVPSGGNAYDLRVLAGLRAGGYDVPLVRAAGGWPRPSAAETAALRRSLAALPDGTSVLVDGLVGCAAPAALTAHPGRLRLAVLVHLPLGEGGDPRAAADEAAVLRAADVVIATSEWTARRIEDLYGDVGPVRVARPGVDPAAEIPGDPAGTGLLCLGSVSARKGQDVLVDALARVTDRVWRCPLVGSLDREPDFVRDLEARIAAAGLTDRTPLVGPRAGADLDRVWADTDLLVLPSRTESYGMVVTEALARGIPVLAADVGGVSEALGAPDAGLLVAPDDPAALAAALARWLDDPDLRADLRAAARARRRGLPGWEVTVRCLNEALTAAGTPG